MLRPYNFWRHTHAIHHATSGHLGRRGIGDVDTLTMQEYQSLSFWGRIRCRTYRTRSSGSASIRVSSLSRGGGRVEWGAQLITFIQTSVLCQTQYATSLGRVAIHRLDRCD
jgi:fatty acid desaturase